MVQSGKRSIKRFLNLFQNRVGWISPERIFPGHFHGSTISLLNRKNSLPSSYEEIVVNHLWDFLKNCKKAVIFLSSQPGYGKVKSLEKGGSKYKKRRDFANATKSKNQENILVGEKNFPKMKDCWPVRLCYNSIHNQDLKGTELSKSVSVPAKSDATI